MWNNMNKFERNHNIQGCSSFIHELSTIILPLLSTDKIIEENL